MSKNYAALAGTVITALGGADNVVAVTHCMTRLRFVLGIPPGSMALPSRRSRACSGWCRRITSVR